MAYKIVNMWVPQSMYRYKSPYAMKPNYLVIHNTANTATARNEVAYMRRNTNQTSYHVAIDEKEVVQAIPFNRNAWHTGDGNDPKNSGNRLAIGIEICRSMDNGYSGAKSSRYSQAEENAALYAAHVLHQFGWGTDRLRQHWHYTRKDCPHKMRAHNSWGWFVKRVQQHLDALKGGKKKAAKAPAKPKSAPSKKKTIAQMADEVEAGKHGSGHANRRKSLGVDASTYAKVRAEVNRRAGVKSAPKKKSESIAQMADEVLAGKHGSGHANRRRSLGVNASTYAKVRAEVNRRAGVSSSAPKGKSIAQMAQEVIDGKHGSGHANRRRSLGVSNAVYQKVRAEVNRRM